MNYIIAYDIVDDKKRRIISELLLDNGFLRVQKSVFIGDIKIKSLEKLLHKICNQLDEKTDSLLCFKINEEDYQAGYKFGFYPDYDFYKKEILYL